MKKTLTTSEIADELFNGGQNGFSYAGARALAEYLEELEESIGEEMELDSVAIRCDYAEWELLAAWRKDYFSSLEDAADRCGYDFDCDEEEADEKTREFIRDRGQLIEFEGGIIVSSF